MAITNFIATVWSARILQNLHKALVFAQPGVVNMDYEGEIADLGNTVKINGIGPVTIGDYTKNANIADPETLSDATQSLLIDQGKYFNFAIDDVDKVQAKPAVMDEAMREASYGLRDAADQFVIGRMAAAVPAGNTIGSLATPIVPTAENAYDYLVDLGVLLSEAKVPTAGRWVGVPSWFYGRLLKDDRFVKAGTATSDNVLRNGQIGQAAGFTVLESQNVPNTAGAQYRIVAGHAMATTYADQIVKIEAYRPEKRFADAMKGLHIYGSKVVRPTCLAMLIANRSA